MPTLPVYQSKQNVTPRTSAPLRQEAAAEFAPQNQIIGALKQTTQAWSDAHDVMQGTKAKADFEMQRATLESAAATDPDFNKSESYKQLLLDAKEKSLSGIDNKAVAQGLTSDFDLAINLSSIKIQNNFREKEIAVNKINVTTAVNALVNQKLSATTAAEKNELQSQIDEILTYNVATGVFDAKDVDGMMKDAEKTAVQYEIYADNSRKEEQSDVLRELKDPNGKYSNLPVDTRLSLVKEATARIFQNNQTYKREAENSRNQRTNNLYEKINKNTATLFDIDNEMKINEEEGGISQKELKSIKQGMIKRTDNALKLIIENNATALGYDEAIGAMIDSVDDKAKYREIMADAFRDGYLDNSELGILTKLKDAASDIKSNRDVSLVGNAYKTIREHIRGRRNATDSDAALAIKKLISAYGEGKNIEEATKDILYQDAVKVNPFVLSITDAGRIMVDAYGNMRKVFPDGHSEPASGGK